MIIGLEHAALSVTDLEKSIEFYRDILGMKHLRTIESTPEKGLGEIIGYPNAAARIAHLASNANMLELFEYSVPAGRPIPADLPGGRRQADIGFIHIAFTSTDVVADAKVLAENGVEFVGDPVEYRPGVWVLYFYGPDREVCELRQT